MKMATQDLTSPVAANQLVTGAFSSESGLPGFDNIGVRTRLAASQQVDIFNLLGSVADVFLRHWMGLLDIKCFTIPPAGLTRRMFDTGTGPDGSGRPVRFIWTIKIIFKPNYQFWTHLGSNLMLLG